MAKDRNERQIKKVDPAFLQKYQQEDHSLDGMEQFVIVPALKIIQSMSDNALKRQHGEGSVIVRPGDCLIWKEEQDPFLFVPTMFFVEYAKWSDLNDADQQRILERSFDVNSEIAQKARDPEGREEPYGKDMKYRYVEHLRFPGVIYGEHAQKGLAVTLSFERGEHTQGRNFISACKMRRESGFSVPLWAQVWAFSTSNRSRGSKSWFGYDFVPNSLIDPAEAEDFRTLHEDMKQAHTAGKVIVEDRMTGVSTSDEM